MKGRSTIVRWHVKSVKYYALVSIFLSLLWLPTSRDLIEPRALSTPGASLHELGALCGATRKTWNSQILLDAIQICSSGTNVSFHGAGSYLEFSLTTTTGIPMVRLRKRGLDNAAIPRHSCSNIPSLGLGPSPQDVDRWVRHNLRDVYDAGDSYYLEEQVWYAFTESVTHGPVEHRVSKTARLTSAAVELEPMLANRCVVPPVPQSKCLDIISKNSKMEQVFPQDRPSIYVYDLPPNLSRDAILGFKRDRGMRMFRLEEELNHAMLVSPLRTLNPATANLFYIPAYPTTMCSHLKSDCESWDSAPHCAGCRVAEKYMVAVMAFVKSRGFFGKDKIAPHLVPFVYDYGKCMETFSRNAVRNGVIDGFESTVAIGPLGSNLNNPCYTPNSDIVISPYIEEEVVRQLQKRSATRNSQKDRLRVYFRGDLKQGEDGTLRNKIVDRMKNFPDSIVTGEKVSTETNADDVSHATFCLCPPGFSSWSYRLVESILGGCIPVLFGGRNTTHPFQGFLMLDYSRFSVNIPIEEIDSIRETLLSISEREITFLKAGVSEIAPLFNYKLCGREAVFQSILMYWNLIRATRPSSLAANGSLPSKSPVKSTFPVDIVYTWVDGMSTEHNTLRRRSAEELWIAGQSLSVSHDAISDNRFNDHDEIRFSLRSVHINLPWIRNIYIVTCCGHRPRWLDSTDNKVVIVSHEDIFESPASDTPSFNSLAIECNLHRIKGLSEHFIIANDDFFFGKRMKVGSFYDADGRPKVSFQQNWGNVSKLPPSGERQSYGYMWACYNVDKLLDRYFLVEERYRVLHQAIPMTKTLALRAQALFPHAWNETSAHRFRTTHDLLAYGLALWVGIYEGQAVRLSKNEQMSNILVNMRNNQWANRIVLRKLLSPCLPSIQHLICEAVTPKMCFISLAEFQESVYIFSEGECRGPTRSTDGFNTMTSFQECVEECMVLRNNQTIGSVTQDGQGAFALLSIGDMTDDSVGANFHKALRELLASFFCAFFGDSVPTWESGDPCAHVDYVM
jgi:hypothetical protein